MQRVFQVEMTGEPASKRKKTMRACQRCRDHKKRCEPLRNFSSCRRCQRDDSQCPFQQDFPSPASLESASQDFLPDPRSGTNFNLEDDSQSLRNGGDAGLAERLPVAPTSTLGLHANTGGENLSPTSGFSDMRTPAVSNNDSEMRYASMMELSQSRSQQDEWWNTKLIGNSNPLSALLRKDIKHRIVTNMCDFRTPEPAHGQHAKPRRLAGSGIWDWDGFYSSQQIQPYKLQYLQALGCFNMPKAERMGYLLDNYFSRVHPMLPILDKGDFLSRLYGIGEPPPLVLLTAVLLAASRYATPADGEQPREIRNECDKLHERLRALIELDLPSDRSAILRASLIASFHWEGREGVNSAIDSLSLAVRIGQEMGIHRRRTDRSQGYEGTDDMSRRIWWCIYAFDRFNAAQEGTPLLINEHDCDIDELQDSDLSNEDPITKHITLLNVSISRIIEQAIRQLYGPERRDTNISLPLRDSLLLELDHLSHRTQEFLTADEGHVDGMQDFWRNILDTHLRAVRILVLRPFLLMSDPTSVVCNSRETCRTEGRHIIISLTALKQRDLLRYSWPFTVYALINALLLVWYDISSPVGAQQYNFQGAPKPRDQLLTIIELLETMGYTWWAAAAKHKLSEALLHVADALARQQERSGLSTYPEASHGMYMGDLASNYDLSTFSDELFPNELGTNLENVSFWNALGLNFKTDVAGNIFSIF